MKRLALDGQRFGGLTVKSLAFTNGQSHWNCVCDCGNNKIVSAVNLRSGDTKSCGCHLKEPLPSSRNCLACGELLTRYRSSNGKLEARTDYIKRQYCNKECARVGYRKLKKNVVVREGYYCRSRNICPPGPCVVCGGKGDHVHHKDGDIKNNGLENLERLCVACHTKKHIKPIKRCTLKNCEEKHSGRGYCRKHYEKFIATPRRHERTKLP